MKAYSYLRFSRPEQLRGDSLRRQLEASAKYAEEHGLELDDTLRDLGVSAYRGKNRHEGALAGFLELARTGKIEPGSMLLVENLDRLSREDVLSALGLFLSIVAAGITIVTLADRQVYSQESLKVDHRELIYSLGEMGRAHRESKIKGQRVAAAWENKRRRASTEKLTARCPGWLKLSADRKRFEIVEAKAAAVQRIFEEAAAGMGKRIIMQRLNSDRIPALAGKRGWHDSAVQKVLSNEAVIGVYQPCRKVDGKRIPEGQPVPGYYPAVIDEGLFWRARAAIKARATGGAGRKGKGYPNLITGLGVCAHCDARMIYIDKGLPPKGGRYLLCSNGRRGLCENKAHHRYEQFEIDLITLLSEVDLDVINGTARNDNAPLAKLAAMDAEIAATKQKLERLISEFEDDGIDAVKARIRKLNEDIKRMTADRAELAKLAKVEQLAKAESRWAEIVNAVQTLDKATGDERYKLRATIAQELRRVIRQVRCDRSHRMVVEMNSTGPNTASYEFDHGRLEGLYIRDARGKVVTRYDAEQAWFLFRNKRAAEAARKRA